MSAVNVSASRPEVGSPLRWLFIGLIGLVGAAAIVAPVVYLCYLGYTAPAANTQLVFERTANGLPPFIDPVTNQVNAWGLVGALTVLALLGGLYVLWLFHRPAGQRLTATTLAPAGFLVALAGA